MSLYDLESVSATATWEYVPEESTAGAVVYRAEGTLEFRYLVMENLGCTVSPRVFAIDRTGSLLTVFYTTDPPTFAGLGSIGTELTISCPGLDPLTTPARISWFGGSGTVSADGLTIEGGSTTSVGTAAFKFVRP